MKTPIVVLTFAALTFFSTSVFAGCDSLQSSPSRQPADVKFTNGTKANVNVLWYTFNGGTRQYRVLAPRQSYVQATFTNHVWAFTNDSGKCLSTYIVRHSSSHKIR